MSEEEILRKKLDRINKNSHYGLMIDSEITKIVRSHIERDIGCDYDRLNCPPPPIYIGPVKVKSLKEKIDNYKRRKKEMKATSTETFHDIIAVDFELQTFPNPDVEDKFIVSATNRDDIFCFVFEGPNLRDACRNAGLFVGCEKDQKIRELEEELKISKDHANKLDKENDWLRKNYMTVAKDEEIKEKNRKINDLYHQLHQVKRDKERLAGRYEYLKTMNEEYSERINALQRMYNLEKEANEAQHKFFVNYAGKGTEIEFNYAIGDTDEVTYVIVEKEYLEDLKNFNTKCCETNSKLRHENRKLRSTAKEGDYVYLGSIPYSADDIKKLKEQIKKLEALKTPTIENFADKEPSDNVNHPSHYTGRYECIDVMQDVFGNEATDNFCLCNAFKYIWRARKKNGLEDVKKAVWYLNKYIEEAENGVRKGEQV